MATCRHGLLQPWDIADWPGSRQYRFKGHYAQVVLWSQLGQCDCWVAAANGRLLVSFAVGLLDTHDLPGLRRALWSRDEEGTRQFSQACSLSR